MAEIQRKPPSQIKIRTLETDVEDMRKSGGGLTSGKILGHDLEEVIQKNNQEAVTFFSTEITPEKNSSHKNKIIFTVIGTIIVLGLIVGFFLFKNKPANPEVSTSPTSMPEYVSLLNNFNGQREFVSFNLTLSDFEKILVQQFNNLTQSQTIKEIVFVDNDRNFISAENILKLLFNNFSGISFSDQPKWEKEFSFIIYSDDISQKSIAYVAKIDAKNLNAFTLSGLRGRFSLAFENLIEKNPEILSSQYLQNVGNPEGTFNSKAIGVINNVRYIKFSSGAEFYYSFYNEYFVIATSEKAFQEMLEMIVIR
jgi:hypothetical protein